MPGTFQADQNAFITAIASLKTDNANPPKLTPESNQIVADCIQSFPALRKGATPDEIMLNAGANLSAVTTCIVNKAR